MNKKRLHTEEFSSQNMIRTRNKEETKAALLAAARLHFARDGYEATSLRDIAEDAGVNVSLISRYFGSKDKLFQKVISFDQNRIDEAIHGPSDQLGERLLMSILTDPAGSNHDLFVTLLRSSDHPPAIEYMENLLRTLEGNLTQFTDAPDAELRASFITALLTGMVILRRLLKKNTLSETSADVLLPYFQSVLSTLLSEKDF
ncbi:transcriptional regulator, TetR family [Seinonella peptonophila]|uniref:Transcriptional regulator, TetR family n=1 Tax=Seinonella peptonophila TaxID=112248 RepID=A0A1M4SW05_9BACL|nr:TetR/AcrR family transcriptional regulator [Seinonella peptonophila]SHE36362.1 transcriptional regulator, TetR family [Seinonella peptonophila]